PGILTAQSVNPTAGLDFNFEFTGTGSPDYAATAASINDVLRITGSTPFMSSLSATNGNVVNVYFDVGALVGGEVLRGGFYTDGAGDFLSSIQNATFNYWVAGSGSHIYNSGTYVPLATYNPALLVDVTTTPQTTGTFADGTQLGGQVSTFTVAVVVPEPSTLALAALGIGLAGLAAARRPRRSFRTASRSRP
ncbi:MAG: PEP-CTERM sorting domain-containing protein, partial [Planctomycetia bacterium]